MINLLRRFHRTSIPYLIDIYRHFLRSQNDKSYPGRYDIIYINPQEINYLVVPSFSLEYKYGTYIFDGQWDRNYGEELLDRRDRTLIKMENYTFFDSVEKYLNGKSPWEETSFGKYHGKNNRSEEKKEKIDRLASNIRRNGYQPQADLVEDSPKIFNYLRPPPEHDEVTVNIGRDGEIIFDRGKHRFCIAKALGLTCIPARVLVRHKMWQTIRRELYEKYRGGVEEIENNKYKNHPDLQFFRKYG